MKKQYDYYENPLVAFVSGFLAVRVDTDEDMKAVLDALQQHKLTDLVTMAKKRDLSPSELLHNLKHLAVINSREDRPYADGGAIFLEFNPGKGATFDWDEKNVRSWFGKEYVLTAEQFADALSQLE